MLHARRRWRLLIFGFFPTPQVLSCLILSSPHLPVINLRIFRWVRFFFQIFFADTKLFSDISVHCGTGGFFKMIYSLELFVVKASRVLQDFVFHNYHAPRFSSTWACFICWWVLHDSIRASEYLISSLNCT